MRTSQRLAEWPKTQEAPCKDYRRGLPSMGILIRIKLSSSGGDHRYAAAHHWPRL
jgi:hypothetical protein